MAKVSEKICERCSSAPAQKSERFCKACRKKVIQELKDAGYLKNAPVGHVGQNRGNDQRENRQETSAGDENPSQSNAIKALENSES
jgi:hypothetical protein